MKRILRSLLMAVGIAGPFVTNLPAQGNNLVADIPFAFVSHNTTLPPGRYSFARMSESSTVFQVRDARGHGDFVMMGVRDKGKPSTVTFACYGKECLLSKITPAGGNLSYTLGKDTVERKLHYKVGFVSMVSVKLMPR